MWVSASECGHGLLLEGEGVIELVQVHDLFLQFLILPPQFMLFVSEKEKNAPLRETKTLLSITPLLSLSFGWEQNNCLNQKQEPVCLLITCTFAKHNIVSLVCNQHTTR